jgi:two-component system CheB/CheR fusion protein
VAGASEEANAPLSNDEQRIIALERELHTKGEYLQATMEELETSNEELTTTNEEMQSSNEELQSTNEELETSKEELQSINEELMTVNTELQQKAEDLSRVNNDIKNLMASTNIGTLYVDLSLRIQRFTPAMGHILKLIETDIRRPMDDIVSRLVGYDHMMADTQAVLDTLIPKESEVQTREGQWYQMHIQPYRTLENVIAGAVLTFVDVSEQKELQAAIRESEEELSTLFDLLPVGASVLNGEQRIVYVNPALEKILGISREGLLGGAYTSRKYLRADGTPMRVEEFAGVRALQEQQAVNHVVTGVVKEDGDVIWTDVSAVPVALRDWKVIEVTFDLGERPQAEETPLN